jgi:hypothetical protein
MALKLGRRLISRDVPDTCQVPWGSTGWTNNRNVTRMLELLSARGEVAVAGRVGRQRLWASWTPRQTARREHSPSCVAPCSHRDGTPSELEVATRGSVMPA